MEAIACVGRCASACAVPRCGAPTRGKKRKMKRARRRRSTSSSDLRFRDTTRARTPRAPSGTHPRTHPHTAIAMASGSAAKRISKELAEISLDPPCNCSAGPKGDNIFEWVSTILGPSGEHGGGDRAPSRVGAGCRAGGEPAAGRSLAGAHPKNQCLRVSSPSLRLPLPRRRLLPGHPLPAGLPVQGAQGMRERERRRRGAEAARGRGGSLSFSPA